jgi:ribose-phosphate pyrophosphokinase
MFHRVFQHIPKPVVATLLSVSLFTSASEMEAEKQQQNHHSHKNEGFSDNVAIISGTASKKLAQKVCDHLGKELSPTDISKFSDGETSINLRDSMRGKDVFVIQTCAAPVNESTMELLLSIGAAKRSGASSVTAVIPYFGYRLNRRGFPISSTHHSRFLWNASYDIAKMLLVLGADKVVSIDLQRPGQNHEACFFKNLLPAETISTNDLFIKHFADTLPQDSNVIFMSPNTELVKKAKKYQNKLRSARPDLVVDCGAFLRSDADHIPLNGSNLEVKGDVKGKDVILISDYIGKFSPFPFLLSLHPTTGFQTRLFI